MRVFLHKYGAGCYYAGDNKWTSDATQALDLKDIAEALALNARQALNATDLIVEHDSPPSVQRFAVSERAPAGPNFPQFGVSRPAPPHR